MRVRLTAGIILAIAATAAASPADEPGAKWSSKCVVAFNDAFRYDAATMPQQDKDVSLWKRVVVAVCWSKSSEMYSVRTGEHLFREFWDKGKLVRQGVGEWTFAPRTYLEKSTDNDVKEWEGGKDVMLDHTPFDEPYKEE
jgi:hypothetical protein